ncbi:MAG TPA: hypothetical protein VKB19_08715 [Pedobacter sp.]|nr:hypothetical protein [Pedobacter sp.]
MKKKSLLYNAAVLIIFALCILTIASCSKKDKEDPEEEQSDYYIKFKVNGKPVIFTEKDMDLMGGIMGGKPGYISYDQQVYTFTLVGRSKKGSVYPGIGIGVYYPAAISEGKQYDSKEFENNNKGALQFQVATADDTFEGGVWFGFNTNVKIKLTTLNDKYYKGTFSGYATEKEDGSNPVTVTEGEFYVSRSN